MPMEKPDDISWQDLFELAKYHQVGELAFFSVEKLQNKPEGEDKQQWMHCFGLLGAAVTKYSTLRGLNIKNGPSPSPGG